jgi:phosphoribosylanthranilate isomerase
MTFLIKICGITRPEDAVTACEEGANAIGLNFWRGSKRFVEDSRAREILAAVAPGVLKVGVFVNPHPLTVTESLTDLGIDVAQFHGDENPLAWNMLAGNQVIRAIRVFDESSLAAAAGWNPRYFLYDSNAPGYGGSGVQAPWHVVAAGARRPFLLAGGLGPQNVAAAIQATRPEGVDVASGVESKPGIKSQSKLAAFIENARNAADKLGLAG